jgi:hypothetical protein
MVAQQRRRRAARLPRREPFVVSVALIPSDRGSPALMLASRIVKIAFTLPSFRALPGQGGREADKIIKVALGPLDL